MIVYLNIIFYAFAYWMCVPVMPFLSKKLGADPVMFGYLQTFAGFAQLIGGPLLGWVVDLHGARFAMSVSQLAGGLSYFLLGAAFNVPMLFFSKIPTIFMHALQSAQMCVTLMGDTQSRPKLIARLSSFYGVGFVCGPALGGFLSRTLGHQTVALFATLVSLISVALNYRYLPALRASDFVDRSEQDSNAKAKASSLSSLSTNENQQAAGKAGTTHSKDTPVTSATSARKPTKTLLGSFLMFLRPELRYLLLFSLLVNTALTSFYTTFSLAAEPRFGMDEQGLGTAMSFIGGLSLVVNALIIPLLNNKVSVPAAVYSMLGLLALALFSLGFVTGFTLYFVLPGLVLSMAVFRAYSVSIISAAVPKEEAGSAIGLSHAAGSLSSVFAPAVTGHLFGMVSFESVCAAQAAVVVLAAVLLFSKVTLSLSRPKTE